MKYTKIFKIKYTLDKFYFDFRKARKAHNSSVSLAYQTVLRNIGPNFFELGRTELKHLLTLRVLGRTRSAQPD